MNENKNKIYDEAWCKKAGDLLSQQLSLEFQAFYFYTECYAYFASRKVALKGLASFYKHQFEDELKHAKMIMDFMIKRGFSINLVPIKTQIFDAFKTPMDILKFSKEYEEKVMANLNYISYYADKEGDLTICQFLEDFLKTQVEEIYEFNELYVNAKRCAEEQTMFLFDDALYNKLHKK
ncbi:Soma ferritin [Nosema granulosis]|uniref:Ferritin n=1 Tax=Nosema granulosis TaxID=83296 RepID=A0A9P6H2V6_9MICR|nr:Soma ferritin [Nosema granulosis]